MLTTFGACGLSTPSDADPDLPLSPQPVGPADAGTVSTAPALVTDPDITWYDIEGTTEAELRAALNALGPLATDGQRYDAHTSWFVRWRFPFVSNVAGCAIGRVSSTTDVSIVMPRWKNEPSPGVARWRDYLRALLTHESQHREHGLSAARDIEAMLPRLPALPSCAEAESQANAAADSILERYRALDASYDVETNHGATQGARFP